MRRVSSWGHTRGSLTRFISGVATSCGSSDFVRAAFPVSEVSQSKDGVRPPPGIVPVRSFDLDQVLAKIAPDDFVIARQETLDSYSFNAWPGATRDHIVEYLLSVPPHESRFHSVIGIENRATDAFAGDIDLPMDFENTEAKLIDAIKCLHEKLGEIEVTPDCVALFSGFSKTKQSFHLHMRSSGCALKNVKVAQQIARNVNASLKHDLFDLGPYRNRGMLRMYRSGKVTSRDIVLGPYIPRDPELARLLSHVHMGAKEFMDISLVARTESSLRCAQLPERIVTDAVLPTSRRSASFFNEKYKGARWRRVCQMLHALPEQMITEYYYWVRIGLSIYSFGDTPQTKQEFIAFSAKCPEKFDLARVEQQWSLFAPERRTRYTEEECFNWPRGYTYIASVYRNSKNGQSS